MNHSQHIPSMPNALPSMAKPSHHAQTLSSVLPEVPSIEILRAKLDAGLSIALDELAHIIRHDESSSARIAASNAVANIGKLLHVRRVHDESLNKSITVVASEAYPHAPDVPEEIEVVPLTREEE